MRLKPIAAICVLLIVVAALSISGCTTNQSTTQHDAFLESYLAAYKNGTYSNSSANITAWDVTWLSSTSVRLQETAVVQPSGDTVNHDNTITVFPTSQDATNYVNAMNLTPYSLASTEYTSGGAYQAATGHAPQIYKDYTYGEGSSLNISEYTRHEIEQIDKIVWIETSKILNAGSPTSGGTPTVNVTATALGESGSLTSSYGTPTATASGNKFVTYAMYFKNLNAPNASMGNPTEVTLRDTQGNIYSYDSFTYSLQQQVGGVTLKGLTVQTNTQPGDKYSGLIAFQIAQNATPKSLTYDDFTNRIVINL